MSDTFIFYVVDEKKLPTELPRGLSDTERHARLVAAVESKGARWDVLEMNLDEFAEALEAIDRAIDGGKFVPVFAFNNSPHKLLGSDGDRPPFGYFNPQQAQDLNFALDVLAEEDDDDLDPGDVHPDVVDRVLYALRSSAAEAAKRGYSLAVVHT